MVRKDEKQRQKIYDEIEKNLMLHHSDFQKDFELSTDASDRGMSAVLKQGNKIRFI